MSELDIELLKQTSDVSITEMLKESDGIKIKLQQLGDNNKEQNQIGE